jgi:predicted membrane channel-forming protein YqfA (hemolysin III family)
LGGRSEVVRGLRGDARDERFRTIDIHAGAFAGFVVIATLVVLALIRMARGDDLDPYGQLLAVGGVSYVVALAFMHWRG